MVGNVLFHATDEKNIESIMMSGLQKGSCWGSREIANYYAGVIEDEGGEPVILAVDLKAMAEWSMQPDLPGIEEPISTVLGMPEEEIHERWEATDKSWKASLDLVNSMKYMEGLDSTDLYVFHDKAIIELGKSYAWANSKERLYVGPSSVNSADIAMASIAKTFRENGVQVDKVKGGGFLINLSGGAVIGVSSSKRYLEMSEHTAPATKGEVMGGNSVMRTIMHACDQHGAILTVDIEGFPRILKHTDYGFYINTKGHMRRDPVTPSNAWGEDIANQGAREAWGYRNHQVIEDGLASGGNGHWSKYAKLYNEEASYNYTPSQIERALKSVNADVREAFAKNKHIRLTREQILAGLNDVSFGVAWEFMLRPELVIDKDVMEFCASNRPQLASAMIRRKDFQPNLEITRLVVSHCNYSDSLWYFARDDIEASEDVIDVFLGRSSGMDLKDRIKAQDLAAQMKNRLLANKAAEMMTEGNEPAEAVRRPRI